MYDAIRPDIEYGFDVQAYNLRPPFQPGFSRPFDKYGKRPREDDSDGDVIQVLSEKKEAYEI